MSGLGNFLAGAVGGVGGAVASISNKYMDDEILRNRQQAFVDMQRQSAVQQTKDIDAYQNDPARRESLRGEAGKDAEAANKIALEGKITEATNPQLIEVRRNNLRAEAAIPGQVAAEQVIANGGNTKYTQALKAIASAQHFTGPGEELARFQLGEAKKVSAIRDQIAREQDPAKREDLQRQEAALTGNSKSAKDLSVALTQTITAQDRARKTLSDPMADDEAKASAREAIGVLDWQVKNLQRMLGGTPSEAPAPYKEGSEVRNKKDGKVYVIRDGVPVLKESGGSAAAADRPASAGLPTSGATPMRIPSPPPETISAGLRTQPNPAFAQWQQRYGQAWQEQQDAASARKREEEQANAERMRSFNPYQQNRP